ncbi:hypothetical protein KIAC18_000277 [Sporomusa sphaeroides]|uniref:hypothetical protein n=1 Tax=Sporomusa sphaeroides TaxID=47679 RepID=UPI003DA18FCA
MSDWAYQLETYKTTLHFWEVLVQSTVWPCVALIAVIGVRWLLWEQIRDLFLKINKAESISFKDLAVKWAPDQINQQTAENSQELPSDELVLMYCDKALNTVEELRVLIMSEQAIGNFVDKQVDCSNNDAFMQSFFMNNDRLHAYHTIYLAVLKWKQFAEESPEKIDFVSFKKAVTATTFLIIGITAQISQIYQALLHNERIDK